MPTIDIIKSVDVSRSIRARQLESIFDVPAREKEISKWNGDLPIENKEWNIGLIVGHSGSGKSTIAKEIFKNNYEPKITWKEKSVIDDFDSKLSIEEITKSCSSVGFNTIPSWLKPYSVLSTGEKFRVEIARRLLECKSPIVVDEFTSVIDRQVAKIGCHAIQKFIRKQGKQFVGVSCHYDIIDWLQPDWIFEPATMTYKPRGLLQRPKIDAEIRKTKRDYWKLFSQYHYMNNELHHAASCYTMFIEDKPVCFAAVIHLPHNKVRNIKRISRVVTLPDWQGLGLVHILSCTLGAAYKTIGYKLRAYPKHPPLIMAMCKIKEWKMISKPKIIGKGKSKMIKKDKRGGLSFQKKRSGGAVFEYIGKKMKYENAIKLLNI
jgi:ABC-type lipoprotein export system ATPase subunit